jgi:outer membrane murein-binding lipoprotein Lpp
MPRCWLIMWLGVGAAVMVVAGCGGAIKRDELERGVETLGATAEEGRLLGRDVARDRSKNTFVRVQARVLGEQADHEAEKLADADASEGIDSIKSRAVKLAQDISAALGDLQVYPGDRAMGAEVAGRLTKLAGDARVLEEEL